MRDMGWWRRHHDDASGEVVLAVDFPLSGRNEAGFDELAPLLGPSVALWETLPQPAPDGRLSGREAVGRWLADLRHSGVRVRALLSYCAGAAFVGALSDGVSAWQERPPEIVMFDPEVPSSLTVYAQFVRAIDRFAPVLTEAEVTRIRAEAEAVWTEHAHALDPMLERLGEMFRELGEAAFEKGALDRRHGGELIEAFMSFIGYLAAGSQMDALPAWKRATAISSHTPINGLNLVPDAERADLVADEVRLDLPHADLLRSPECARLVTEALAASP
ncbi:hypothetical protein [Streptomyces sp. PT12]|uniref:hypothetical protein n=1 Tax=Streptomyces sp. PT12 TaxID=1510197 RepID=UPI0015EF12ED|nr:hypothetical protein [Streptomyces sp. PT12]